MDDEAGRLKVLIETNTLILEELRRLEDPSLANLIGELERARTDAKIQLAEIRAESQERQPAPPNDTQPRNLPTDRPQARRSPQDAQQPRLRPSREAWRRTRGRA